MSMGIAVYLGVMLLLAVAVLRRRSGEESTSPSELYNQDPERGKRLVLWGGALIPTVILLVVAGLTLRTLLALSAPAPSEEVVIDIIGHQWWWEIRYEVADQQFSTANEVHVPVDTPVRFRITSDDVIHSFWVPELQGKMDMIPGTTNELWIEANQVGDYWGVCTEFCGVAHAQMQLLFVAQTQEAFQSWALQQQAPAPAPQTDLEEAGLQVFYGRECLNCHVIRGTDAVGNLGPDLTHFASRRTLAAGIRENNVGNLSGWIVAPQTIKPGNHMPGVDLTGEELQALLAYLATLE